MNELNANGFLVLQDVLPPAEIRSYREALGETVDRVAAALRAPVSLSAPGIALEDRFGRIAGQDHAYAVALFRAVMADAHRDERIGGLASHPRLNREMSELLTPLTVTGRTIRPRALVPGIAPDDGSWHQDVVRETSGYNTCGTVRLACWAPLADVDETSGALEVMPGAWKQPLPHVGGDDGRFSIPTECLPEAERRVVSARAGDVVVLDRFVPHRTSPLGRGRAARWAVAMWLRAS
jgi:hypothetical protein